MTLELRLIACIPVDRSDLVDRLPPAMADQIPRPSIVHTIMTCRCGRPCWIGPNQKQVAEEGKGIPLCYFCIIPLVRDDPDMEVRALDPDHDKIPRRT